MIFTETTIVGVTVIDIERKEDTRGFFARTWSTEEFGARGLAARFSQGGISHNRMKGTLRGMHCQSSPYEEAKLIRCTRGAFYDVALDLRRTSVSYGRWFATELTEANYRMVYIPEGCAHGFQTLEDDTEVMYQITMPYHPENARGVRWDDPAFGIQWPGPVRAISVEDRTWPLVRQE